MKPLALLLSAFLVGVFLATAAFAKHLPVPFAEDRGGGERWGYQDRTGAVVIEPTYIIARDFSLKGIAAVATDKEWLYIDTRGNAVIRPHVVDNGPDPFSDGLARFTEGGKFGFFDEGGKVAIPARYDYARPFSEGLAAVCAGCREEKDGEHIAMVGGTWGYIDKTGAVVIPPRYTDAREFENGHARVKRDGAWVTIERPK